MTVHIVKRVLSLFILFTAVPVSMIWVVQSQKVIDLVLHHDLSFVKFITLSILVLPPLLLHILPILFSLSVIYLLYILHQEQEMVILFASGKTPLMQSFPFLIVTCIVMVIMSVNNLFFIPYSAQSLKKEIFLLQNDLAHSFIKPAIFQKPSDHIRMYFKSVENNQKINGFFLEDRSNPKLYKSFTAQNAILFDQEVAPKILLENGQLVLIPKEDKKATSVINFEKFTLDFSKFSEQFHKELRLKPRDYYITQLLNPDPNLSKVQKIEYISQAHQYLSEILTPLSMISVVIIFLLKPLTPRRFPMYEILSIIISMMILKMILIQFAHQSETNIGYIWAEYCIHFGVIAMALSRLLYISIQKKNDVTH